MLCILKRGDTYLLINHHIFICSLSRKSMERWGKILLGLVIAILIVGNIYFYWSSSSSLKFAQQYSVAVGDIDAAYKELSLARVNFDLANGYLKNTPNYNYTATNEFYDKGKEQTVNAGQFLNDAKSRLILARKYAPDEFFTKDVDDRLNQVEVMTKYDSLLIDLLNLRAKEVYEVNYGDRAKATDYSQQVLEKMKDYNVALSDLNDVSSSINTKWNRSWY